MKNIKRTGARMLAIACLGSCLSSACDLRAALVDGGKSVLYATFLDPDIYLGLLEDSLDLPAEDGTVTE